MSSLHTLYLYLLNREASSDLPHHSATSTLFVVGQGVLGKSWLCSPYHSEVQGSLGSSP